MNNLTVRQFNGFQRAFTPQFCVGQVSEQKTLYNSQTEGEHSRPPGAIQADLFSGKPDSGRERFAVLGDAGTGDQAQWDVARQMNAWHQKLPFQSVLVLGDNVYQTGEPQYFRDRIFDPYANLFRQGVKFLPVLGNHDVKAGFGDQQLAYWGVPPFYKVTLGQPGNDVDIFALDTTVMLPGKYGGFQLTPAQQAEADQREIRQAAWLESALSQSKASMKVVMGHYPLHGAYAKTQRTFWQAEMARKLGPVLEKYGVDLYLAGHEHHYEAPVVWNGVQYIVSGAGGKLNGPNKGLPEGNGIFNRNHFMLFENTPLGLNYRTVSAQGQIFDFGMIPRKRRLPATNPFQSIPVQNSAAVALPTLPVGA